MFFGSCPSLLHSWRPSSDANAAPDAQREMPPGGRLRKSSAFHRSATILKFVTLQQQLVSRVMPCLYIAEAG